MMAGLFLIFFIVQVLIIMGKNKHAFMLAILNVILCIGMFLHHATDILKIRL